MQAPTPFFQNPAVTASSVKTLLSIPTASIVTFRSYIYSVVPRCSYNVDNLAPKKSVLSLRNCPRALSSLNITTSRNFCKSYFTSNNLLPCVKEPRTLHRIQLPHAYRRVSRTHSHLYKDVLLSFIPALLHAESTRDASSNQ